MTDLIVRTEPSRETYGVYSAFNDAHLHGRIPTRERAIELAREKAWRIAQNGQSEPTVHVEYGPKKPEDVEVES